MEQQFKWQKAEDQMEHPSVSDPVEELLFSTTGQSVLKSEEAEDTPVFECQSPALTNIKVLIWSISLLLFIVPLVNLLGAFSNWPLVSAVAAAALGIAICVQLVPNRSFVKVYRDRIEWRAWGEMMESQIDSVRLPSGDSRIVLEDSQGKQIGILPFLHKADTISILAALHNMGHAPKLPSGKTWLVPSLNCFTYETYQINWLRIFAMALVGFGPLVSLSLVILAALPVGFWILPIPISFALSFILGRTASKQTSRNRYEFTANIVKKFKSGQEAWSVDLEDVRHVGFAAQLDSSQFVLVTNYGRRYLLPPAWNVVLPFVVWRGLKLIKDEEMQAELEKPISFKKTGL